MTTGIFNAKIKRANLIKDIDTKLSEEINNINTKIEANKTQLIQWMYTIVFAAIGIILAFFRLIS